MSGKGFPQLIPTISPRRSSGAPRGPRFRPAQGKLRFRTDLRPSGLWPRRQVCQAPTERAYATHAGSAPQGVAGRDVGVVAAWARHGKMRHRSIGRARRQLSNAGTSAEQPRDRLSMHFAATGEEDDVVGAVPVLDEVLPVWP